MEYQTLISPAELEPRLGDPDWAVFDCRFSLDDTEAERLAYLDSHIPTAVYAHLDEDLSGPIQPGKTGRHPLPSPEIFAEQLSRWGIDERVQVVAYDDSGGAIAARLWWMLRWLGHGRAAVLEGGWSRWLREDRAVSSRRADREARTFRPEVDRQRHVDVGFLQQHLQDPDLLLVDARDAVRFRGEKEPIDPVAGHIPGAVSLPYADNLTAAGDFLPPDQLKERFKELLRRYAPEQLIFYCGSGVTSIHNILAMVHAGLPEPRLYPGSWSEWIADPERPRSAGQDRLPFAGTGNGGSHA